MLTDIDKEFDTPEIDENGELIEVIEEDDVFIEEDTGLEEQPDSFYEAEEDIVQEGEEEEEFDNIQEVTVEAKENYDNAKEQLVAIFTSILEKGEITAEDNVEIEQVKEQYSEAYNSIKENTENVQKKTLEERVQELADGMTPATAEAVLDILTDNGRKPWLYKDDDNNVLIDGTSIPELTVLVQKLNLIATDGENEGQIQLSPGFINMLATSAIVFTAANINLNGYISNDGGNFALDQQGNMEVQDLSVKGEFSCESLTSNTLNNPKYPEALDGSMNVNIDETNGNDDIELEDGATFQTIGGFFNKCPKNLNGRTINVSFKTDITENVSISYFYCGRIRFYCEGHKISGWVRMEYIPTLSQMFGGSVSDPYGETGAIMPYVGLNQGSVSASFVNYGSVNTALYNMKVYKAANLASGCKESVAVASGNNGYTYVSDVTPINCEYGFRTNSHGRIHSNSSGGKASKYGFVAVSGGYITLSNGKHTGGTTDNTYFSSGGQVIPGSGATFVGTAESGSNTSTTVNTTKSVTYTSNSGNTYRTTYSSWRNDGGVIQGNAYGSGNCIGYWFFGSQFLDLKGCSEISKVVLKVKRLKIGSWSNKLSLKLAYHNQTGKQTTPNMPAYFQSTDIGAYSGDYVSITITNQTVLDRIKAGTLKGFALYDSNFASGSYGGCSGTAKVTITYKE